MSRHGASEADCERHTSSTGTFPTTSAPRYIPWPSPPLLPCLRPGGAWPRRPGSGGQLRPSARRRESRTGISQPGGDLRGPGTGRAALAAADGAAAAAQRRCGGHGDVRPASGAHGPRRRLPFRPPSTRARHPPGAERLPYRGGACPADRRGSPCRGAAAESGVERWRCCSGISPTGAAGRSCVVAVPAWPRFWPRTSGHTAGCSTPADASTICVNWAGRRRCCWTCHPRAWHASRTACRPGTGASWPASGTAPVRRRPISSSASPYPGPTLRSAWPARCTWGYSGADLGAGNRYLAGSGHG